MVQKRYTLLIHFHFLFSNNFLLDQNYCADFKFQCRFAEQLLHRISKWVSQFQILFSPNCSFWIWLIFFIYKLAHWMLTAKLTQTNTTIYVMSSQPSHLAKISPDWFAIWWVVMVTNQRQCTLKMWRTCMSLQTTTKSKKKHQQTVHQQKRQRRKRRKRKNIVEIATFTTSKFDFFFVYFNSIKTIIIIHLNKIFSYQIHRFNLQKRAV